MIKITALNRYCSNKLDLSKAENSRHTNYDLRLNSKIALPLLIRISRGSGDAANNNIRGIAKALGLSLDELKMSIKCDISRECVFLCLCVTLLNFINEQLERDPVVHLEGAIAMGESIDAIINDLNLEDECSIKEDKTLLRLIEILKGVKRKGVMNEPVARLESAITKYHATLQ